MVEEKQEEAFQPIDLHEVIGSKNPKLAKRVPAFMYRWLSKILHLKEVNSFLEEHGHLNGAEFIEEGIKFLGIKYEVIGLNNLPQHGRYIVVANHPLGGLDGMIILKIMHEKLGTARSLTNDFLLALKPLREWFVPINKVGGQPRDSITVVEDLYKTDHNILIFPAGLCSRKINGKIEDLEWQKHFIQRAVKHEIDIIPIYFEGYNSNHFYNLARLRKFLRIKFNFEMLYLVDELFKHKNKTFKIHIGKTIPYTTFDKTRKHLEWAKYVKEYVYNIKSS